MRRIATVLAAAAPLLLTGCPGSLSDPNRFFSETGGGDRTDPSDAVPSDAVTPLLCPPTINVERDILNAKCGAEGCHGTRNPQGSLDLASPDIHGRIQGVASTCDQIPLLGAMATHGGYLLEKVIESSPSCGTRMPPGPALSAQEIDCLREWAVNGNMGGNPDASTGMDAAMDATTGRDAAMDATTGRDAAMDAATKPAIVAQAAMVTIEAEDFDENVPAGDIRWSMSSARTGASAGVSMAAGPNAGVNRDMDYVASSPRLTYVVNFQTAGTYTVWIRGWAGTFDDDSIHLGIDGMPNASSERVTGWFNAMEAATWRWASNTNTGAVATIAVPTSGRHTIDLWMREDGAEIDRILLTTDTAFVPMGTGPAASPRTP